MQPSPHPLPVEKRVVLVGAGNAHLVFARMWRMRPVPGVAVTLVNDAPVVPYSAMVPGHLAGEYTRDEVTIDLVRVCRRAGLRLIAEPVVRIDPAARRVHFAARPPLGYDILSLGLGSVPTPPPAAGDAPGSVLMRPLGRLIRNLDELAAHLRDRPGPFRFAVVGGGASGCELALAIHRRLAAHPGFGMTLFHAGDQILPGYPGRAARAFDRALRDRGVSVRLTARVVGAEGGELVLADGGRALCDAVLWATDPAAPQVLRESGLALDPAGFLLVRETLQAVSDPAVFGTGDCVSFPAYPQLPKNGVQAVREGRVLFDNIAAALRGGRLRSFRPRRAWLSLLNMSNGRAVAAYGPLAAAGRWARHLKSRIDRRWMKMFTVPPPPPVTPAELPGMRCGGCGSKVPGDVLADALKRLDVPDDPRVLVGCRAGEDAAVFRTGPGDTPGPVEVQTVDHFTTFVDDPFLFGRVAALHAVSDLYAMNARPFAALAVATVPHARGRIQADQLHEMLAGAAASFADLGVVLAGGHTTEGSDLALGFAVTGHADEAGLFRKGGLRPGDVLVLTKPLGTGALLAAWMRAGCRAEWFTGAVRSMLGSNRGAADVFARAGVRGCTDVTGFGLAGHLLEMLDASRVSARLDAAAVPVLAGFSDVVSQGVVSTLHEGNARVGCRVEGATPPAWLFDPQTSGGLVAGVRPDRVKEVIAQLRAAGSPDATVVGEVVETGPGPPVIHLT
ncbi:MAG: pyridine nucleotide-disulfide oxidoreductase family protein [Gemmataceae bacterium]|nr:pyridine nucleotide-disulfide oxidoreductase family protein [Gemmataceae bacterium]